MSEQQISCESALLNGSWERAADEALAWARHPETSGRRDPRPHFVLNVVQLIRGQFAEAWTSHALSLQETDDIARVKVSIEGLVAGHVDHAAPHLVMGLFLSQSGQSEESMQSYRMAAKLAPQSAYPHYFLAQIHERANHIEMAIKEYREAVRLDPAYAQARTNLGVAYQEQGRLEMAIPQYREVIKLNPNDAVAHANLACALAEQGKLQAALLEYQEALRLNPRDAEVHFALGGLYENKNRPDLAMKEYREAVEANRDLAPAHSALGWMLFDRGHREEAMECFNHALRADPQNARAYLGVAKCYASRGKEKRHHEQALQGRRNLGYLGRPGVTPRLTGGKKRRRQGRSERKGKIPSLLKMISRKAAGTLNAEAYCLSYVEVAGDRERSERKFSAGSITRGWRPGGL